MEWLSSAKPRAYLIALCVPRQLTGDPRMTRDALEEQHGAENHSAPRLEMHFDRELQDSLVVIAGKESGRRC